MSVFSHKNFTKLRNRMHDSVLDALVFYKTEHTTLKTKQKNPGLN